MMSATFVNDLAPLQGFFYVCFKTSGCTRCYYLIVLSVLNTGLIFNWFSSSVILLLLMILCFLVNTLILQQ